MDSSNTVTRSLPPLVEGKVHGYLTLCIDNIVWNLRNPGNVTVLVSWWGELDNVILRPSNVKFDDTSSRNSTETYAIKTNLELFEQYLDNCETVELLVISEKSNQVIGTANITDLRKILPDKKFIQYFPIYNDNECKIGDIHITVTLSTVQKMPRSPRKLDELKKKPLNTKKILDEPSKSNLIKKPSLCETMPLGLKNLDEHTNIYRSILRDKRSDHENVPLKINIGVTDKLVAEVVARAQRLRGAMLNDSHEDALIISDSSNLDSFRSDKSIDNEATLYEYFMGKQMSRRNEKKALELLRSHSPTPSLIDFAAATIRSCNENNSPAENDLVNSIDQHDEGEITETPISSHRLSIQPKEACPIDFVDSLRVVVDSLTLNDAGYRRVRSSCLSRGDGVPISVTYIVQYDAIFVDNNKKLPKKGNTAAKPVRMCSKRQEGQVIFFHHEGVYDLQKTCLHMDMPIKFRIFNRHLNQRTPTELGIGSIYISDAARSPSLSTTQRLAIVKKGIKIGELKVTVELGCDKIHFGKSFVEAVTSTKENIPVLELSMNTGMQSERHRTATGGQSKTGGANSVPERRENAWTNSTNATRTMKKTENNMQNDERIAQVNNSKSSHERILLHGLIYIGEGKDLLEKNTYLICRAFWREDRAFSRVCNGTSNPFYDFHQLEPLIHGQELLERTKDNCIVTEVYAKNPNGADNLLGIAKLSVHQLYIAYRDPEVLPHLLKSKYPVISVDGWVSITDPVSGRICGQILALVALGTADQIALLEMTRGLRDSSANSRHSIPDRPQPSYASDFTEHEDREESPPSMKTQESQTEIITVSNTTARRSEDRDDREDATALHAIVDRLAQALSVPRTIADQGAQTEEELPVREPPIKMTKPRNIETLCLDASNSNSFSEESSNNSPRDNFNMSREMFRSVGVGAEYDEPINQATMGNYTRSIDSNAPVTSFNPPTTLENSTSDSEVPPRHNSVETDGKLQPSTNDQLDLELEHSNSEDASFRAIVEIECALHLPKVETNDETVEPCTYVTFQKVRNNARDRIGAYMMTDVYSFSCNPKYDWRCDTKLSTDLLINEEKRLIMKVWRLAEPKTNMRINLEKDVVIGFSAIDLSVLTAGFPTVSGWFHIMDFAGKCNGQMKVSVTPLDNIAAFGKYNAGASRITAIPPFDHSNFSSPYPLDIEKMNGEPCVSNAVSTNHESNEEIPSQRAEIDIEPTSIDIGLGLGDASMSFLSLSLKQKLTELDEIKKRLESRLQDVTSTAFDDDFDDFDVPEHDATEQQHTNDKNGNSSTTKGPKEVNSWLPQSIKNHLIDRNTNTNRTTNGNHCSPSESDETYQARPASDDNTGSVEANYTDTGYSSSCNLRSATLTNGSHSTTAQRPTQTQTTQTQRRRPDDNTNDNNCERTFNPIKNGHNNPINPRNLRTNIINYQVNDSSMRNCRHENTTVDDLDTDNPIRGTRVHINHLLDQLSTQLTAAPPPITSLPMKRNIMDLISTLRRNNNNFPNDIKCNREANVRTVPTQTEGNYMGNRSSNNSNESLNNSHDQDYPKDDAEVPAKRREKISTVIREELVSEDTDSAEFDFLSTHLMTSNVRHMGLSSILNPLLYPHILPDISPVDETTIQEVQQNSTSPSVTPEDEAVERLDSRYAETFNAKINKGLGRLRDLGEVESTSSRLAGRLSSTMENTEMFRVSPTGVTENADGNIDVTVIHKPCNDDLMASNSVASTTISFDNNMQTANEIDDDSSLNSTMTSVSAVSRQAPEGGNPAEDPARLFVNKQKDYSPDTSSSSS